jgi:hypothetical protein
MTKDVAMHLREDQLDKLLSVLGLTVLSWEPIHWKRVQTTPVFLIRAREGEFFLKLIAPPATKKQAIARFLFGNLSLKNQLAVYSCLDKKKFSSLQYPRLVKTDGRSYLLFEFLTVQPKGEGEVPQDALVASLLEFQCAGVLLKKNLLEAALLDISRKPVWVLLRRILGGLRRRCGLRVSLTCLGVMLAGYRRQKPLRRSVLAHNDFHHNNLLLTEDGELYIGDFEKVSNEKRWILIDIVHYAVGTMKFEIGLGPLKNYLQKVEERLDDMERFHLGSQLRMALLLRVSQMILSNVPPAQVRERYESFLKEILLDNLMYERWLEECAIGYKD